MEQPKQHMTLCSCFSKKAVCFTAYQLHLVAVIHWPYLEVFYDNLTQPYTISIVPHCKQVKSKMMALIILINRKMKLEHTLKQY